MAREFEDHGIRRLHVVDLDGAKIGKVTNLKVLEKSLQGRNLQIDFGGGIKTGNDLRSVFDAGAKMAGIGSIAVKEPEKFFGWLEKFGSEKILLGADVKDRKLAIDGWQTMTELEDHSVFEKILRPGRAKNICYRHQQRRPLKGFGQKFIQGYFRKSTTSAPDRFGRDKFSGRYCRTRKDRLQRSDYRQTPIYEDRISLSQLTVSSEQ